jgi:translation initiation factor IF-3
MTYRINREITAREVLLVREERDAAKMSLVEALAIAEAAGLDLVEVSPTSNPPVCKIQDYGKLMYREQKKKHSVKAPEMKEVQFSVNVGDHDYQWKLKHIKEFLTKHHKVKVVVKFVGRENAHRELGLELHQRIQADLHCNASISSDMKSMFTIIDPVKYLEFNQ